MRGPEITPELARELFGTPEEIDARLQRFRKDAIFFSDNLPRLREDFPNHWVAIYEEEVLEAAPTVKEILPKINEHELPDHPFLGFVSTQERNLKLAQIPG